VLIGALRLHISLFLASFCLLLNSQWSDSTSFHKNKVFLIDTSYKFIEPELFLNRSFEKHYNNAFYDSLALKAGKRNWSRELYHLIVRDSGNYHQIKNIDATDRVNVFNESNSKIIRKIKIRQLDVFGPTINDPLRKPQNWIEETGNSLHIPTNERYIRNNLFVEEGERVNPYVLADNERILRNISSLQDVRFYLIPVENMPAYVDLLILTKDVMALGFSWEVYDIVYGEASVWNNNLLGLGHQLKYTAYYNLNREPKYGYDIRYKINNILTTFTSLELAHTNRIDLLRTSVNLNRNFITPATKFGGGVGYRKTKKHFELETIDTIIPNVITNEEYYDFWGGYSLPVKVDKNSKIRQNYFFAGRAQIYSFLDRPVVAENYLYDYYKRTLFLGSIGYTWQGYHTTKLVYGFGNTEDLPYGAMVKFTSGYEQNEFHNRQYYATTLTYSKCFDKYGYISNTLSLGGFYRDKIEQGVINYSFNHISPLFGSERHQFRNFIFFNYIEGINRFDDEYTLIENSNGIRGINTRLLKGDKRFYGNNEFVYYSPHSIFGFRFVYFMFVDAGIINHSGTTLIDNPLYMSTGIGMRIRNERLVFNTIQLEFNFFPISPGITDGEKEFIKLSSFPEYRIPEFADRQPHIIEY
jgi:hypothetical protein